MNISGATRLAAVSCFFLITLVPGTSETFRFKFREGDTYRVNSLVNETAYMNRVKTHSAEITNRVTMKISDVQPAENGKPASARNDCTFMTSVQTSTQSHPWGQEYPSVFQRDELGDYDIGDEYFMPVVRNVPTFPTRDVKAGESWTGTGEEAHDLRAEFGIKTPFKVPFTVTYTYVGEVDRDGKKLHLIQAEYTLFYDSPNYQRTGEGLYGGEWPVTTMGYSKQKIYFDNERGIMPYYTEEFRIQLQLSSGDVLEFRGTAEATVTSVESIDRDTAAKEMNDEISRLGLENTSAKATDEGVTISIENIQFSADSANLLPAEKEKIKKLAALLERYPDKELLISGHTALAGTPAARQRLSEERAEAVAKFLVDMGVRDDYEVYTRGYGADKPIVPNTSEENRARNRRVEITILDK